MINYLPRVFLSILIHKLLEVCFFVLSLICLVAGRLSSKFELSLGKDSSSSGFVKKMLV